MIEGLTNIDFYKEMHDKELQIKLNLSSLIRFPTTILTLLIGGAFYLFKEYLKNIDSFYNSYSIYLILLLAVSFTLSIAINVFYLIKMYHNAFKKYKYLPLPSVLYKREKQIFEHYKTTLTQDDNKLSKKELKKKILKYSIKQFQKDIFEYYIDCATHNQIVNEKRFKHYYNSRKYTFLCLGILVIIWILLIIK